MADMHMYTLELHEHHGCLFVPLFTKNEFF